MSEIENNINEFLSNAKTLLKEGKFDDAEACFESAIALTPGDAELYKNIGNIYFDNKKS